METLKLVSITSGTKTVIQYNVVAHTLHQIIQKPANYTKTTPLHAEPRCTYLQQHANAMHITHRLTSLSRCSYDQYSLRDLEPCTFTNQEIILTINSKGLRQQQSDNVN
jgi:hypothetical protein